MTVWLLFLPGSGDGPKYCLDHISVNIKITYFKLCMLMTHNWKSCKVMWPFSKSQIWKKCVCNFVWRISLNNKVTTLKCCIHVTHNIKVCSINVTWPFIKVTSSKKTIFALFCSPYCSLCRYIDISNNPD